MKSSEIEHVLSHRFQLSQSPTLVARTAAKIPVAFTRLRTTEPLRGRSLSIPHEESFAFQVPLSLPFFTRLWIGGKEKPLPVPEPEGIYLFDLSENPTVGLDAAFDTMRFYISQVTIDELAYEQGLRRIGGLRAETINARDPVLHGLARTLALAMEEGSGSDLFAGYLALAFHAHIIHTYGNASRGGKHARGGLTPWQIRRVNDWIEDHLASDPSIAEMAALCGLSASHFARAFRQTMAMPPHQWLMYRRLAQAKALMQDNALDLASVALACGFADQSHFTRVFSRVEGVTPGRWRRTRRL